MRSKELYPIESEPELLRVKDPVGRLVADLRSVRQKGVIRIFCGEASVLIYNDAAVIEAFQFAKRKRQATILVNSGPVVMVDGGAYNGLRELRRLELVEGFYVRPTRGHTTHFRIVETDSGYGYYEEPRHRPLTPAEDRSFLSFAKLPPAKVKAHVENARAIFDQSTKDSTELASASGETKGRPILATVFGLSSLLDAAEQQGLDLDTRAAPDLVALAESSTPNWLPIHKATLSYPREWILLKVAAFDWTGNISHGKVITHSRQRQTVSAALSEEPPRSPPPTHASYVIFRGRSAIHAGHLLAKLA